VTDQVARRRSLWRFLRYWLPVLMYVTLILVLSAQQNLHPPDQFHFNDKFYHLMEYFGLGALLARAFRAGRKTVPPMRTLTMTVALGVLVGVADEIFQSFIKGRNSDVFDVLADATGVLLSQVVFLLVVRE
jgi:VanZ family protein